MESCCIGGHSAECFICNSQGSMGRDLNFTTPIPGDTFEVKVTYWDEGRYISYPENLGYIEELIADKIFKTLVRRE